MTTIDAKDMIIGRMASEVAKRAIHGETINIVNSEEAVIVGRPELIIEKYKHRVAMGTPRKGPFIDKQPHRFLKRMIRGMLPHKQEKGASAYKRILCYVGVPEDFKKQSIEKIELADIKKTKNVKYIKLKDLCKYIGHNGE